MNWLTVAFFCWITCIFFLFIALRIHGKRMGWISKNIEAKLYLGQSTEPIVGYRVWRCEDGRLLSVNHIHVWPCRKPLVKDKIENLGIHAIKNGANVPQLFVSYSARVAGEVYLWGEVKEHTEGYLAEFAYPKELWMPEDTDPMLVMELEENYGVPVKLRADLVKHDQPLMLKPGSIVNLP